MINKHKLLFFKFYPMQTIIVNISQSIWQISKTIYHQNKKTPIIMIVLFTLIQSQL